MSHRQLVSLYHQLDKMLWSIKIKTMHKFITKMINFPKPLTKVDKNIYICCCLFLCFMKYKLYRNNSYFDDNFDDMMTKFYTYLPHDCYQKAMRDTDQLRLVPLRNALQPSRTFYIYFDKFMRVISVQLDTKAVAFDLNYVLNWRGKNFLYTFTPHYIPIRGWRKLKNNFITEMLKLCFIQKLKTSNAELSPIRIDGSMRSDLTMYRPVKEYDCLGLSNYEIFWPIKDYDCLASDCSCRAEQCTTGAITFLDKQNEKAERRCKHLIFNQRKGKYIITFT